MKVHSSTAALQESYLGLSSETDQIDDYAFTHLQIKKCRRTFLFKLASLRLLQPFIRDDL